MSIEIIKPGGDPRKKRHFSCRCGCEFTATEDDARKAQNWLDDCFYFVCQCPNELCNEDVWDLDSKSDDREKMEW